MRKCIFGISTLVCVLYGVGVVSAESTSTAVTYSTSSASNYTVSSIVPTAPSSVIGQVKSTSVSGGSGSIPSIQVQWQDRSSNETKFMIFRARVGESISPYNYVSSNITTYTDLSVIVGMSYIYGVEACNGNLCSLPSTSNIVNIPSVGTTSSSLVVIPDGLVKEDTTAPNPPTGAIFRINTQSSNSTAPSITISWNDTSSNETGFRILKTKSGESTTALVTVPTNYSSYVDTGVQFGATYIYSIQSCINSLCSVSTYTPSVLIPIATSVQTATSSTTFSTQTQNTTSPTTTTATQPVTTTQTTIPVATTSQPINNSFTETSTTAVSTTTVTTKPTTATTTQMLPKKITGLVTFPDGTPVMDAEIAVYNKSTGDGLRALTGTDGKYSLMLSYGTWELRVRPKTAEVTTWSGSTISEYVTFSTENSEEIQTKNFVVTPLTSRVTIHVLSDSGEAISGVGVVVDTLSSALSETSTTVDRRVKTDVTNSLGDVTVLTKQGTYYIRVAIPQSLPYAASEEKIVTVLSGESKTVTVSLKKLLTANTRTIMGTTKFDNDTPAQASVYAWSDNGDSEHTSTLSTTGAFSMTLLSNRKWHISAKKDAGTVAYTSSEVLVDTSTSTGSIALVFSKSGQETLPPTVTTRKTTSEQVSLSVNDGASLSLPANAVIATGPIQVEVKPTTEAPSYTTSQVVSTVYDITVKNTEGVAQTKLASEAEIVIPYDEADLKAQGVSVDSIVPSYYDEKIDAWVSVSKFTINKERKIFILRVDHLTRFALIAAADVTPPTSPTNIVADYSTGSDIKISWSNPTSDFHHSKVYKSTTPGLLGDVVATEVMTSAFTDKSYSINGKTYYYTVRAIDAAGNESSNLSQALLVAKETSSTLATAKNKGSLSLPPGQTSSLIGQRILQLGSKGEDVSELQTFLKKNGYYPEGLITGYFGKRTKNAVKRFQTKYASEILTPHGFKSATGMVGNATKKKIVELSANETIQ